MNIDSEISTDSGIDIENETLYERIAALKDMIPPATRRRISNTASSLASFTRSTLRFGGKALWILSTSAFLLGVPWALAYAEEEQYIQMEREQGMIRGANEVRQPLLRSSSSSPSPSPLLSSSSASSPSPALPPRSAVGLRH